VRILLAALLMTTFAPHAASAQRAKEPPAIALLSVTGADGQLNSVATRSIATVAAWESRRQAIRNAVEQVMGEPPPHESPPLDLRVIKDEIDGPDADVEAQVRRRKVSYHTDSGDSRVDAWLLSPVGSTSESLPAVLCLHQTVAIGKDEPAGLGGNPHLHYALELARRGYVTLAPDYPSFGEHDYDFTADDYQSGSMKAIRDNVRAVDLLQSLPEVDRGRIGVIGHSLGGHNAIFTAFFEPRLRVAVSCCGFTRFHRYYHGDLKGWTSERYMPRIATRYGNDPNQMPFDFPELIAGLAPRPFLAVAPVNDDNFDVIGVRETIHAAESVYRLYNREESLRAIYPDSGHDFPDHAREIAYSFLDQHLAQAPAE